MSKPVGMARSWYTVRARRVAATTSASDSANCATINPPRSRSVTGPPDIERPPSPSEPAGDVRNAVSMGNRAASSVRAKPRGRDEESDPPVDAEIECDRIAEPRDERHGELGQPARDDERRGRATHAKQQRFDEHEPRQPGAAGAEGAPHGYFTRPFRGAREEQVRDVGAGDEQHEQSRAKQQFQRTARSFRVACADVANLLLARAGTVA